MKRRVGFCGPGRLLLFSLSENDPVPPMHLPCCQALCQHRGDLDDADELG